MDTIQQPKQRRGQAQVEKIQNFQHKINKDHNPNGAIDFLNQLQNTIPSDMQDLIENSEKLMNEGINMLVYGTFLKKLKASGTDSNSRFFFLSDEDNSYLHYFSKEKPIRKTRINLKKISNISIGSHPLKNQAFMNTIILEMSKAKSNTFIFDTEIQKMMIGQAINYLVSQAQAVYKSTYYKINRSNQSNNKEKVVDQLKKNDPKQLKGLTPQNLDNLFEVYQNSVGKSIQVDEFAVLMEDLTSKKEIFDLYKKYCKTATTFEALSENDLTMSLEEIKSFWKVEQCQDLYPKDFEFVIKGFSKDNKFSTNRFIQDQKEVEYIDHQFSFKTFAKILFHKTNSIFNNEMSSIYQPMTNPLTDYYICSSHNTYLEGNQLQGISSTKAYIDALQKGCRCVEIDCWDGADGQPIVYHGHTLTTKIKFRDVIQTLAQYAFKWSEYPLILSLEVHCSYEQQGKMADIMTEELLDGQKRSMIYTLPKDFNKLPHYPSPHALKRLILIKGKGSLEKVGGIDDKKDSLKGSTGIVSRVYLNKWRETIMNLWKEQMQTSIKTRANEEQINKKYSVVLMNLENKVEEFKDQFRDFDERQMDNQNVYNKRSRSAGRNSFVDLEGFDIYDLQMKKQSFFDQFNKSKIQMLQQMKEQHDSDKKAQTIQTKLHEKLEMMVTLFTTAFDVDSAKDRSFWQISSLDEHKILRLVASNVKPMGDYHRFYFSRIYPAGTRVQSSNYEPLPSFISGVINNKYLKSQIVALNFQTIDLPLFVLLSKFQENGGQSCGYLLKPSYMRLDTKTPLYPYLFRNVQQKITIKVISAQHLHREVEGDVKVFVNPQVHVFIKGSSQDESRNIEYKTKIVKKNGFNPRFDSQDFRFTICNVDHTLIIFQVFTIDSSLGKKALLGQYGLPINCVRQGYRVVPLRNSKFIILEDCFLFVKVDVEKLSA